MCYFIPKASSNHDSRNGTKFRWRPKHSSTRPQIIFGPIEFGDIDVNGAAQNVPVAGANVLQLDPNDLWNEGVVPPLMPPIGAPAGAAAPNTLDIDLRDLYDEIHLAQPAP